jgi:putative flippase GtrA
VGFFLHKHVTFSWKQRDGTAQQFVSYMLTLGANIVLSSALLWFAVEQAGMYEPVAKLIVDVVTIVIAFVLSRWLVYRPS